MMHERDQLEAFHDLRKVSLGLGLICWYHMFEANHSSGICTIPIDTSREPI